MITDFRNWVTFLGNNDTNEYSFPFKISDLSEIVVVQLDISSDPTTIDFIERGDVGLNVQEIEFDSVLGGGKVIFENNLPVDKRIYIKMANDAPTQPSRFREQKDFKLRSIEDALDFIVTQTMRLTDKAEATMRFADHFSHVESVVNLQMPEFPMAHGMPIMDTEALQLNMKPILTILAEAGVLQLITDAQTDADTANSRLDLLEPRVTQAEADIDALQVTSANHETRIITLESTVIGGGSSGVGALKWYGPAGTGALRDEHLGLECFKFSQGASQNITTVVSRTITVTAIQKTVQIAWMGLTNNVKWTLVTRLIKPGQSISSTTNQHTHSVETAVTVQDAVVKTTLQVSDAAGKINGLDIDNGDTLVLTLSRTNTTGTDDVDDSKLLPTLTKVNML